MVSTWSKPGPCLVPKILHTMDMSLYPKLLCFESFRDIAFLKIEINQTWSKHGSCMILKHSRWGGGRVWGQGWGPFQILLSVCSQFQLSFDNIPPECRNIYKQTVCLVFGPESWQIITVHEKEDYQTLQNQFIICLGNCPEDFEEILYLEQKTYTSN